MLNYFDFDKYREESNQMAFENLNADPLIQTLIGEQGSKSERNKKL